MRKQKIFISFVVMSFILVLNVYAQETVQQVDRNKDNVPDTKIYYNASGVPVRFEVDQDQNGKKDIWGDFRNGLLFKTSVDRDGDMTPDVWVIYNPDGTTEYQSVDKNNDGLPDVWVYFRDNKLDRQEADKNFDGRVDLRVYYSQGNIAGLQQDVNFDGKWDKAVGDIPKED